MRRSGPRIPLVVVCASVALAGAARADDAADKGRGSTPSAVIAEEKPAERRAPPERVEEITVTGSYIKRTRTDGPQAVEVVDRLDIATSGIQSPVDLIDKLAVNAGSEFRSDAFKAGGQYGTANVNLRGLGLGTTLVLVDGRRQVLSGVVSNDGASFVDINNIPLGMLERVEVLKEGAAATYGSDAVAGVVNFITRKDFEGFELNTQYQTTTSDGQREQGISGLWGWKNDYAGIQLFANYYNQNELESEDRKFTQANRGADGRFLASSPFGQSSLGNPGALAPLIPNGDGTFRAGAIATDPGCEQAGGVRFANGRCGFEFADNFNLAENEQRVKYAATFSYDFSETLSANLKWNYAFNKIDDVGQSPSFPPSTQFFVPDENPGNFLPGDQDAFFVGRPLAESEGTERGFYDYRTNRYEAGLQGQLGDTWSWDANLSYARSKRRANVPDTFRTEFALALEGFGGSNCRFRPSPNVNQRNINPLDVAGRTIDDSQRGQGDCQFFAPGSAAILDPSRANSQDVIRSFTGRLKDTTTTSLLVAEGVLTGELLELPAGPLGLAVGYQYRRETYDVSRNRSSRRPDRFTFLAGGTEFNSDRGVTALFSELSVPVRDNLELQLAVRYEEYNGSIGSSVDPKFSFRYQPFEWLGVRGGFSTTFRAPTLNQQLSERTENEVISDPSNTGFLPIDNRGSQSLQPEEADVYNFGLQYTPFDQFSATLDYFRIDFSDLVVSENAQALVDEENRINGGPTGLAARCNDPGFQASPQIMRDGTLASNGRCPISRIEARFVNQDAVITDGIDLGLTYDMQVRGFDSFRLSTNITHLIQYDIKTDRGTISGAGLRNELNFARALPKFRGSAGVATAFGPHSAGFTVRYVSSYDDDDRRVGFTKRIDDHTTYDVYYGYEFSQYNASLQIGVLDLFNREPPFVNTDFNFDSRTADARGRRAYANMTVKF